jgi:hypothetical protein
MDVVQTNVSITHVIINSYLFLSSSTRAKRSKDLYSSQNVSFCLVYSPRFLKGLSVDYRNCIDGGSRVRFPAGTGNFSLHHRVQNGTGTHPASYPMGTRGFSLGLKRPGREADHTPPSSAEVKE